MENPPVSASPNLQVPVTPPIKPSASVLPKILIALLLLLVLAGTGILAYWYGMKSTPQPKNPVTKIPVHVKPSPVPTLAAKIPTIPPAIRGITWNTTPKQLSAFTIFKSNDKPEDAFFVSAKARYFLVGSLPDGTQIINTYVPVNAPSDDQFFRLLKSPTEKITILIPPGKENEWLKNNLESEVIPGIEFSNQNITELNPPETFISGKWTYLKAINNGELFSSLVAPVLIAESEFGRLYRTNTIITDRTAIVARQITLRLKDDTVVVYRLQIPILNDDRSVEVVWQDQSFASKTFTQALESSCSRNFIDSVPIIRNPNLITNKSFVGQTKTGESIYQVVDANSTFINDLYSYYKVGRDYEGSTQEIMSQSDFTTSPNHFIWQDGLGDWQVFVNQEVAPMAECGKPVIYLYPEKTTNVHVSVGAKIRLSDPPYPQNGWDVNAKPSGELTYQGRTYPNLFWEGLGEGYYPDYRDRGTVVPQNQLLTTLNLHLTSLGLNSKESADFMEFWQPKLPLTPYVRLTWLGTADMDRLAPLTVSPSPDTKIRIFLEFEGLNQPKNIKPQTLSAPARHGFTLIEWGGLLIKPRT